MKKIIVAAAFTAAFVFSGCTENKPKTVEYYKLHVDEAKEVLHQCKSDLVAAMNAKDTERMEEIQEDKECIAAKKGIKQYKKESRGVSVNWENMPE